MGAQGGAVEGTIYGDRFPEENNTLRHYKRGILARSDSKLASRFHITFTDTTWFDGYHTVFGEVVNGQDVLDKVEEYATRVDGVPSEEVKITDCGQIE